MTDAEIVQFIRDEYRNGRRSGRVREPEWDRLVAIAEREDMPALTIHGTWAQYEPVQDDPMLIFGDHFTVRIGA